MAGEVGFGVGHHRHGGNWGWGVAIGIGDRSAAPFATAYAEPDCEGDGKNGDDGGADANAGFRTSG
jgi:hypothetical protein